jgi:hypothetical protein
VKEKVKCPMKIEKKCLATKNQCDHAGLHVRNQFCNMATGSFCKSCVKVDTPQKKEALKPAGGEEI